MGVNGKILYKQAITLGDATEDLHEFVRPTTCGHKKENTVIKLKEAEKEKLLDTPQADAP